MSVKLNSPRAVAQYLKDKNLTPLKRFGQNFLCDENVVRKIAAAACPENGFVLEIGMGLGILTQALADRAARVVAVEIDRGLARLPEEDGSLPGNARVLEGDFLEMDLAEICQNYFGGGPFFVCGNLPYYITGRILLRLLESGQPIQALTAMVQKEVAQRLTARPGTSDYSGLTALAGFFGAPRILFGVSRRCFYPSPDVDSAVIRMDLTAGEDVPFPEYRRVVNMAFAMRRKTVRNNLRKTYPDQEIVSALAACGVDENARAQDVSPGQFACLAKALSR